MEWNTYRVNDTKNRKIYLKIFENKKTILGLFIWHNELSFFQNIMINTGIFRVRGLKYDTSE